MVPVRFTTAGSGTTSCSYGDCCLAPDQMHAAMLINWHSEALIFLKAGNLWCYFQ